MQKFRPLTCWRTCWFTGRRFRCFLSRTRRSPLTAGKRRRTLRWKEKGRKREMQKRPTAATHFSVSLFPVFSTSAISPFLHPGLSTSRRPRSGGSVSIRPSSSLTPNLGVVADGGGGRVRMVVGYGGGVVGSFVPIPFPISPFSPYGRARRAP